MRWTWVPRRPKPQKRFEAAISALVVRNGWQGIIYVILDVLKKSRETLIRLVAAALDHEKYNLGQTLLRMLKDVPVTGGGAINGTSNGPILTGEDAVDVFYIFATHTSASDSRAPVLRMLFEVSFNRFPEICPLSCFFDWLGPCGLPPHRPSPKGEEGQKMLLS